MQIVINNERPPSKEGLYFTIDTAGTHYITRFREGSWQSQTGHPVEKWIDPEMPSFTIEDMNNAYRDGMICTHERMGQGISSTSFARFMKKEYNIDITKQ